MPSPHLERGLSAGYTYAARRTSLLMCAARIRQSLEGGKSGPLRHGGPQTEAQAANSPTEAQAAQASFEEAQLLGAKLADILSAAKQTGEQMPAEAVDVLRVLISTTAGARGWFVTLLTNPDYDAVFRPPLDEGFLSAICEHPDPNIRLCTVPSL